MRGQLNPLRLMALSLRRTELGAFARRMPRRAYLTACLRWCLDTSVREELARLLKGELAARARWQRWGRAGAPLRCHHCRQALGAEQYVRTLCELAVAEMANPERYARPSARADFAGCSYPVWRRDHAAHYAEAFGLLQSWLAEAFAILQRAQREAGARTPRRRRDARVVAKTPAEG